MALIRCKGQYSKILFIIINSERVIIMNTHAPLCVHVPLNCNKETFLQGSEAFASELLENLEEVLVLCIFHWEHLHVV